MKKLTFQGKRVRIGKRKGVYIVVNGRRRYLSKEQIRKIKRRKKGSGMLWQWGSPPGYSS